MFPHHFLFIAGLHRSGTTLLANILAAHPDVSSFKNTGFPKDEGQFLQSVFPPAKEYGGPGVFGFKKEMHLTEKSSFIQEENRRKLFKEWSHHWDLKKRVLLEKSPPNILKSRFLQEIFPNSSFVFIMRHPIAVSYATKKWSNTPVTDLLKHWVTCHNILMEDTKHLSAFVIIKYEDFVRDVVSTTKKILNKTGLSNICNSNIPIHENTNEKYFIQWKHELASGRHFDKHDLKILQDIDIQIQPFGYTLFEDR